MRDYYYLSDLHNSPFNLTLTDALYLGATETLTVYTFISELVVLKGAMSDSTLNTTESSIFVQVPPSLIRTIERDVVSLSNNLLNTSETSESSGASREYTLAHAYIDRWLMSPSKSTSFENELANGPLWVDLDKDPGYLDSPIFTPARRPPKVKAHDLICWAGDLQTLADQKIIERRNQPSPTRDELMEGLPSDFAKLLNALADNELSDLEALIRAWRLYWTNVDRSDRSSFPKKEEVKAWLEKQGLSKKNADSGATMITPRWAANWRK